MVSTINLVIGLIITIAFGAFLNELAVFIGTKIKFTQFFIFVIKLFKKLSSQ